MNLNLFLNSFYSDLKSFPPPPTASTKIFISMYQSRESIPVSGLLMYWLSQMMFSLPSSHGCTLVSSRMSFSLRVEAPRALSAFPQPGGRLELSPQSQDPRRHMEYRERKGPICYPRICNGEGNGTPLQYSCLENPMDRGAWWAAVHGVTKSQTCLSNFTFTFHFHTLKKEMATHSSVLA